MSDYRRTGGLAVNSFGARGRYRSLVAPPPSVASGVRSSDLRRYAFPVGFAAMVLIFALPTNLLTNLGLYSEVPGGNPLTKFHPGTYLAILAAWFALYGRRNGAGVVGLFRESPALAWSIVLILIAMVYSGLNFGVGGTALYVETYLGAALLLIALETGTERQIRFLGYSILAIALANVVISVLEARVETHLFAPTDGAADKATAEFDDQSGEFRGAALYAHPLAGALVTSMALFLAIGMRLRAWITMAAVGALFIGLMSFGGRGALLTTVLLIAAAALFQLSAGLVTRRLSVGFLVAFIAGALLLPVLFVALTTMTDIGQRILSHLYFDDSAEVRVQQWQILGLLKWQDVLSGVPPDRIEFLKAQIGLLKRGMDIENFWLLMFLNLGVIGFPFFAGALFLLLLHQGQRTNTAIGWMVVTATLLICSTSNSLGRKSPDLFFLAGVMTALGGFRSQQRMPLPIHDATGDPADGIGRAALADGRVRALADRPLARPANNLRPGQSLA